MVKKLKFITIDGRVLKEESYNYNYPEDWEDLMDPGGEYSSVEIPDGFVVDWISYFPSLEQVNYYCLEGTK